MPRPERPESELRAERYLSRVTLLQSEMTCQLQHLRALRERYRAGGKEDTVLILRIRQVRRQAESLQQQLSAVQREVSAAIARLPDPRVRAMMEMRYLSGLTWEEIAEALFSSPRAALRMHQRALRQISLLLPIGPAEGPT
jgi:DNA-directed RNA polymerase specialized sigma24 family protein